jgi:hypothetical protein
MELLKANYLNTTTSIVVNSNTDAVSYLFDRDTRFQYISSGYTGVTVATLRINFDETMTVSRLALMGHNLKDFVIYYNGATANTFNMSSGAATTSSNFSTNSETSQYFRFNAVACTSVSIDMRGTMVAAAERFIGYLAISDTHIVFDRPPSAKNYKVLKDPKDVVHTLSDGGTRIQNISDKWTASLKYSYLSTSVRNSLYSIWSLHREMVFCPFGTTTSWDGVLFPCVWEGNFDFFEFSDNAVSSGFSGSIKLKETPR